MSEHDACPIIVRTAQPEDACYLLQMIRELADYERMTDQVTGSERDLQRWLFGPDRAADSIIALHETRPVGYAVFFRYFSTFSAKPGMYLEDIYVRPDYRGCGIGMRLMQEVARRTIAAGCTRLEWSVLDWNQPAINFYRRLGAQQSREPWLKYGIAADALQNLV